MESSIAHLLIELNHRFYTDFGENFSATRRRIQPGVYQIISALSKSVDILDLGCGNGEIAHALASIDFQGTYTGLDFSAPLLGDADQINSQFPVQFIIRDLSTPGWEKELKTESYSIITAFAFFHHIPSDPLRIDLLQKIRQLLKPGGRFIMSNWQFLNSEKLRQRIQPWDAIGLNDAQVDPGDYLLDWRSGGKGLRYAHHYSAEELTHLAQKTGFCIKENFLSDGENNRLGLYHIWEKNENT